MTTAQTRPGDALSETQRRFLVAVMERVPRALVHEVYLFAPMKQGSVETGIAVVAIAEPAPGGAPDTPPDESGDGSGEPADVYSTDADPTDADPTDADPTDATSATDMPPTSGGNDELQPSAPTRVARFTVFTARYRLQLKGPERGRWDVDVVEEADAPLVTVDAVVRGVHRRSGEPSEVERLAPHDLARALGEVPWTSES